ncbi:OmpA family protein [Sulfidibacter corallicola]|uniref:OmpA family protein n=1 Tax=Sulfidibacter corallicola TaxID=2818388 RepID=A0A8A4TPE9_SULCO|nr:phosphate ABC transporter substrate-binding/OmpA family protein [Sulfidibacter corallicola]QTD51846.1 OmpA family protein [Sulfidibacter corallicola]
MKKSTIGFVLLLLVGGAAIFAWKYVDELLARQTSVRVSRSLRIGGDNYLGYWFINSPEMRKQSVQKDFSVEFHDDGGAYGERLAKFAAGEYDCIVLPVNTYLEQGRQHDYPGVVVAAISESKGADGIVARADRLDGDKINALDDPGLNVVYTADSPSSFLLDLTIADFDLARLRDSDGWRQRAGSSEEVLERARKGDGDVFVLWEPDLSKALALDGMNYLWGSDDFSGYIVDVFVFHRDVLRRDRKLVHDFLATYFQTQAVYANDRERMVAEMARSAGLKKPVVAEMIPKIDWLDLRENCSDQFGIAGDRADAQSTEGLVNTIIACTDVLLRTKQLDRDPLEGNPYQITNRSFLEELARDDVLASRAATARPPKSGYAALDAEAWSELRVVGTFRLEPITFQSWNNLLAEEGKARVDRIAATLTNNYPQYRIIIRGHTGPGGDEAENRKLSLERAQVVRQYLLAVHGMDANRLLAQGIGSSQPLPRKANESQRAWRYRLPRVEFVAVEGNVL